MEQKINIWDEFNTEEIEDMPAYILEDMKMIFNQYESKIYELKDGYLFKLTNPYHLTDFDEEIVLKHCTKRDDFNYILMKRLDGKERLQRPGIQKMALGGLQARRL